MAKIYINQQELADFCGCKQPYIAKLKKQGVFNKILHNNKFLKSRSTEYAKIYEENKNPTRDSQRSAIMRKKGIKDFNDISVSTNKKIKTNSDLYNLTNLEELEVLLENANTGNQKVQIIKDFWTGKINKQKFLENEKQLIKKEQITKDIQRILKAFRDKTLAIPLKISSDLLGLKTKREIAGVVESYMYELLEELSALEDLEEAE
jgi:predicted transcriptional regulator